jgi:RHS repeat-associated protein
MGASRRTAVATETTAIFRRVLTIARICMPQHQRAFDHLRSILTLALFVFFTPAISLAQPAPSSEVTEYYGLDAIGSVRIVFDGNGNVVARLDYAPFGREVSPAGNAPDRKFAQLFRDQEAGLDYAQARSYQVRTGRFNGPDPIYSGLLEPQRWNRYSYANNNSIRFIDPNGLLYQSRSNPGCQTHPHECINWASLQEDRLTFIYRRGQREPGWIPPPRGGRGRGGSGGTGGGGTGGPGGGTDDGQGGPGGGTGTGDGNDTGGGDDGPEDGAFRCAANVSSRLSVASLIGASPDNWWAQTFLGNDFASLTDLVYDLNIPNVVGTVVSNPLPANATAWGVDWTMRQRIGPRDVADLYETSSGHTEVKRWLGRYQIGKTVVGKGVAVSVRVLSTGKLWYDAATYAGSFVYCVAK